MCGWPPERPTVAYGKGLVAVLFEKVCEESGRIFFVVNHQDPARSNLAGLSWGRQAFDAFFRTAREQARQSDDELAALADAGARGGDLSFVHFNQALHQR